MTTTNASPSSFRTLVDLPAVITQTHNLGVHVADFGPRNFRLVTCDRASGWDVTGPVYPTKTEALANVDRAATAFYG